MITDCQKQLDELQARFAEERVAAMQRFEVGHSDLVKRQIAAARKRNDQSDVDDEQAGFAPPGLGPLSGLLRTVLSALGCGMECGDWEPIAEAVCMLQDAEVKARQIEAIEGIGPKWDRR